MYSDAPSKTAYRAALSRARHQACDFPLVFEDPLALRIIGTEAAERIRKDVRSGAVLHRGLRAALVARSRIAEDALHHAVSTGVRQYVVLGAGLDTFAYRSPYPSAQLKVFEVDRPAAQEWKRRALAAADMSIPDNVTYIPIDFNKDDLVKELVAHGVDLSVPTFFSWLGVTMYLQQDAVIGTLRTIAASFCPGSTIVFDYIAADPVLNAQERVIRRLLQLRYWAMGEPWKTFFEPAVLANMLCVLGYGAITNLTSDEIYAKHFKNRKDTLMFQPGGMRRTRLGGLMTASI